MFKQLIIGIILSFLISLLSYKTASLTSGGLIAAFFTGSIIFGFGGLTWSIPLLTFFILSSLLSKLVEKKRRKYESIFEKGGRRDQYQVLANGSVAALTMIIYVINPNPKYYIFYLGALATATADTWATEIGSLANRQPRLITNFKKVPHGTSGGITIIGSIGAFLGSFVLALSGSIFLPENFKIRLVVIAVVSLSGFLGNLVDSLLGATVQMQYQCRNCLQITEKKIHCNNIPTTKIRGIRWFNNDATNFVTTLCGWCFTYLGMPFISCL